MGFGGERCSSRGRQQVSETDSSTDLTSPPVCFLFCSILFQVLPGSASTLKWFLGATTDSYRVRSLSPDLDAKLALHLTSPAPASVEQTPSWTRKGTVKQKASPYRTYLVMKLPEQIFKNEDRKQDRCAFIPV